MAEERNPLTVSWLQWATISLKRIVPDIGRGALRMSMVKDVCKYGHIVRTGASDGIERASP